MTSGGLDHLRNLGLRDLIRKDPTHADAILMNVQHDSQRCLAGFVEEAFKDISHKLHRRVVIIENQHAVHRGLLGLRLRLGDDGRPHAYGRISLLFVRHDSFSNAGATARAPIRYGKLRALEG